MRLIPVFVVVVITCVVMSTAASSQEARPATGPSSCIACHSELEDELHDPVSGWPRDVHAEVGLGCEACHGGDPSPEVADDVEAAKSASKGFKPAPGRLAIATFCGNCHSDATFMKQYDPQGRVDQLSEYRTSVHGKLNAQGDPVPATCTDCHGVHGIRRVTSPDAPVFPSNVPGMCSRCHSDAAVMAPYDIPTDQHETYMNSVHATALLERGDTAAPACNDCHGNHGAAPPGVQSVANVCGQCHGREAKLFRASFKKDLFDGLEMAECTVCHGNHSVVHPTAELFRSGSAPRTSTGEIASTEPLTVEFGELDPGQSAEVEWTVSLGPHLESDDDRLNHRVLLSVNGTDTLELDATVRPGSTLDPEGTRRVESAELVASLSSEPLFGYPVKTGDAVRLRVELESRATETLLAVRLRSSAAAGVALVPGSTCLTCHSPGDECDQATERMYVALSSTERDLREAEQLLHQAEVAGMDVGEVQFELNSRGITALLDARALIHSFDPDRLVKRSKEAGEVAASALQAGQTALDELQYRRQGLAVSLVLIALVLTGLFLKIRDVNATRRRSSDRQPGPQEN
jgi:hypothetical protein